MKILLLYDYPPCPSGLATQGDLLYKGLLKLGIEVHAVNIKSSQEKEWYYRWFKPDFVTGIGYWGHTPDLILHPLKFDFIPVPWFVADGYIANYHDVLNSLPLILVTSHWVKEVYMRDGINGNRIMVLPVGCDTDSFTPRDANTPEVKAVRQMFNISDDEIFILTVGGDAASKGAREVMKALAEIKHQVPSWKYICKVWPQERTERQNILDLQLAEDLGIRDRVDIITDLSSRDFMPYLMAACDIYAAPSRLEGFGMCQIEAGACGKPVLSTRAMGMLDTLIHGETAFLADVSQENRVDNIQLGLESGYPEGKIINFTVPRVVDCRADVRELAQYLKQLMVSPALRNKMGKAGMLRVIEKFDYRMIAKQFIEIISNEFGSANEH